MKGEQLPSFHDVLIDTLHQFEILQWISSFEQCGAGARSSYQDTIDLKLLTGPGTEFKTVQNTVHNELASRSDTTDNYHIVDPIDDGGISAGMTYQESNGHNQICRKILKYAEEAVVDGEKEQTATDSRLWGGKLFTTGTSRFCEQIHLNDQNVLPLRQKCPWRMGPEIGIKSSWNGDKTIKRGIAMRKSGPNTPEMSIPGNCSEQGKLNASNAHAIQTKWFPFSNVRSNHDQICQKRDQVSQLYDILEGFLEGLMNDGHSNHKDQGLANVLTSESRGTKDTTSLNPNVAWDFEHDCLTRVPSPEPSNGYSILEELHRLVSSLPELTNFDPRASEHYVMRSEGTRTWVGAPNTSASTGEGMCLVTSMANTKERSDHHIDTGDMKSEMKKMGLLTLSSNTGTVGNAGYCSDVSMLKNTTERLCHVVKQHCESLIGKENRKMAVWSGLEAEARERERLKSEKATLEKCLADALSSAEEGIFMCDFCKDIVNQIEEHRECQQKNMHHSRIDQSEMINLPEPQEVKLCGCIGIPLQNEVFDKSKESIHKPQESDIVMYQISDDINLKPKPKVSAVHFGESKSKRKSVSEEMCQTADEKQKKTKYCQDISEENHKHSQGSQEDKKSEDFFAWSAQMIQEIEKDVTESHFIMASENIVDIYDITQDEPQNKLEGTKILALELETDDEDNVD